MWNEIMSVTFIDSNQIISIILFLKKAKKENECDCDSIVRSNKY